jgi:hypothetical protein
LDDRVVPAVSLPYAGFHYVQDFNALAAAGTSNVLPAGWAFAEAGGGADGLYAADDGAAAAGDV